MNFTCVRCDKICQVPFGIQPSLAIPAVHDAIVCRSYGNYGSREYDADSGEMLQFILCDECLVEQAERIHHLSWNADGVIKRQVFSDYRRGREGPDDDFLAGNFTPEEIAEAEAAGFSPDDDQWVHRDCPDASPSCIINGTCVVFRRDE